jgi:hypothetical protein
MYHNETDSPWDCLLSGLGIAEFTFGYIARLCLRNNRMKRRFTDNGLISFDSRETVVVIDRVHIEAYPSHHLDAMRGQYQR